MQLYKVAHCIFIVTAILLSLIHIYYTTYYTYDSTFHIPIKISKKKDSSTTIITNYTLTSDKSSIETMTVTENNSTKKKRAYVYDDYGNIITEKRYILSLIHI